MCLHPIVMIFIDLAVCQWEDDKPKLGNPWCFPLYEPLSDDNVLSVPCVGDKSTLSNFKGQFQSLLREKTSECIHRPI